MQVMKTLEQSIMELEEEPELPSMSQFKHAWHERLGQLIGWENDSFLF